MRLPACTFGTLTVGLLGLMGRRLFNWRTGLITALIYACMTLNIRWRRTHFTSRSASSSASLPSGASMKLFGTAASHRYLTLASIPFCLAFLSWEGSGFILPALVIALMLSGQTTGHGSSNASLPLPLFCRRRGRRGILLANSREYALSRRRIRIDLTSPGHLFSS